MGSSSDTSSTGSDPYLEWEESFPTRSESTSDTAPHDMTALARVSTADPATVFREGQEEAIRALYVVMRSKGLTTPEMDAIVLKVRGLMTRL